MYCNDIMTQDFLDFISVYDITGKPGFSFKKPLHIHFCGEDAVDDGGPRREFFQVWVM